MHLTQTDPKGKESKSKMVETIREAIDSHARVYVFSFDNMRTAFFQAVRKEWPDSRFFLSKNKVMQVALGRDEQDEYATGLHEVAKHVTGSVGLLVTDHTPDEVGGGAVGGRLMLVRLMVVVVALPLLLPPLLAPLLLLSPPLLPLLLL